MAKNQAFPVIVCNLPWKGLTQENGIVISESASKKFSWNQGIRLSIYKHIVVVVCIMEDAKMPYYKDVNEAHVVPDILITLDFFRWRMEYNIGFLMWYTRMKTMFANSEVKPCKDKTMEEMYGKAPWYERMKNSSLPIVPQTREEIETEIYGATGGMVMYPVNFTDVVETVYDPDTHLPLKFYIERFVGIATVIDMEKMKLRSRMCISEPERKQLMSMIE